MEAEADRACPRERQLRQQGPGPGHSESRHWVRGFQYKGGHNDTIIMNDYTQNLRIMQESNQS